MTNFHFYGKINKLFIVSTKDNTKIITEANTELFNNDNILYHKHNITCNNKKMKDLNVNLEEAANYLIQLFYNTGKIYSCTRTKVGKLLSIVSFIYAKNDEKLFKESIRKYCSCGTAFNELKAHVDRELYDQAVYQDDRQPYTLNIDRTVGFNDIPHKHKSIDKIPFEVANTIESVFRRFASYSPGDLGLCINQLILQQGVIDDNDEIDLLKIKSLTTEISPDSLNYENADVIRFLLDI